jgi:hypothetical protein
MPTIECHPAEVVGGDQRVSRRAEIVRASEIWAAPLYPVIGAQRACNASVTAADTGSEAGGVTVIPAGEASDGADATAAAVWVTAAGVDVQLCHPDLLH